MKIRENMRKGLISLVVAGTMVLGNGCDIKSWGRSRLNDRLSKETSAPNQEEDKYAVLIHGINEEQYQVETGAVYKALLKNGFKKENIYVLDQKGSNDAFYPSDGIANKENIKNLFSHLEKKIDEKDILVVNISDHGIRVNPDKPSSKTNLTTAVVLPYEILSESEFKGYLDNIKPKFGLITNDICYGGGIAQRVGNGLFIGVSQTTNSDVGYSRIGDSFGRFFYNSFTDAKADRNFDGKVTIDEAFNYAIENQTDSRKGKVKPQLISDLDVTTISLN